MLFLNQFSPQEKQADIKIPDDLATKLVHYNWPGNVRELKNFAEKISVLFAVEGDFSDTLSDLFNELDVSVNLNRSEDLSGFQAGRSLKELEMEIIRSCLDRNDQNISKTARELQIDRATLRKKITADASGGEASPSSS